MVNIHMITKTDYTVDLTKYSFTNFDDKVVFNEPTGDFFYNPWKIKKEYEGSMWDEILSTIQQPIGEARLIKMSPGTTYMSHSDIDDRWHLNIQGEESYLIDLSNKKMHLLEKDNTWYKMNAGVKHVASNFGSIDRIQLVVRSLLRKTIVTDLIEVTIKPSKDIVDYRYQFDKHISPWLHTVSKLGLMKDFMHDDKTVKFKTTVRQLQSLPKLDLFEITTKTV